MMLGLVKKVNVNIIKADVHMNNMLGFTCLFTGKFYDYAEHLYLLDRRLR